jgi:7 transmembrane receptor (rhodopsin family)
MADNLTKNYFLVPEDQLPDDIKYGLTNTVVIAVYSLLLLASLLVNSVFLAILIRRRHRTRTHYLMINLCLSNFYLVFVEMPLQIAWNATVYWAGSEALCRALSYFSIIGLYGNAFFTVAIALDRWQAITSKVPTKTTTALPYTSSGQRTCLTIVFTWTMAHICSIPQVI